MNKQNHYEIEIPEDYVLVEHIDARNDKKRAKLYMLFAYLPLFIIFPILCLVAYFANGYELFKNWNKDYVWLVILIAFAINFVYVVLHELTHGITYKCFTGSQLTFGYAITVAFCGVPHIYVKKKASMFAIIMPFVVFTFIFLGLTIGLWFISPLYGLGAGIVLSLHLGGCFGDLYWFYLFLTKYKHCHTLRKDNGPEQWLYIPKKEAELHHISIIK